MSFLMELQMRVLAGLQIRNYPLSVLERRFAMIKKSPALERLLLSVCFLFATTGCVATRYIASPTNPPEDLGLRAATEELGVTLNHVIVPGGPGSWVQGARWNEWVLTIKNLSKSRIEIAAINLIDPRGVYVGSHYDSLGEVESESNALAKQYTGIVAGQVIDTAITNAVAPLAAQAFMTTGSDFVFPFAIGLGLLPRYAGAYMAAKDNDAIRAEFKKRRLPYPLVLSDGGSISGSAFLPLIPQPRALIVTYKTPNREGQVKIPLENVSIQPPPQPLEQRSQVTGQDAGDPQ